VVLEVSTLTHIEFLEHVLGVLALVHKHPLASLLDLQPKDESQFAHHAHLKFPAHSICKLGNKSMRRATEDYIIHLYLNQMSVSALLEEEQSFIYGTHSKTLLKQESFQALIPGSRGLFQTIQGFVEFKTWLGNLLFSKLGGYLT
jgi:hypothetical protein